MEKKYELIKEDSIEVEGRTLYRIRALKDFIKNDDDTYDVKKGSLGGYVQKEENLSHEGNCWVSDDAKVFDSAVVKDNALVTDVSMVFGNSMVIGSGLVTDKSKVYGFAIIQDDALVMDRAEVYEHAVMEELSSIGDDAKLYGSAKTDSTSNLRGFAEVYEYARLRGECLVDGDSKVYGHAVINGQARITDHASVKDNGIVSGRVMMCGHATVSKNGKVFGVGRIDFNITGNRDVAVYSDPINLNHYITASTKEDWFTGIDYSGTQKDFLGEAKKRNQEEFDKYSKITNLHLDLYDLRGE
jgi:UDP-3-O-[3-hydroxymyristoyl] glucosamine N-acyltransferase